MRARNAVLAVVLALAVACTSSPRPGPTSAPRATSSGPPMAGLRPVRSYAQELCGGAAVPLDCPKGAVPGAIRRPLAMPSVPSGAPCPTSDPNPSIWSRVAPGLGPGPVAPVGLGEQGTLKFRHFPGSEWGGQKVLWVAAPGYDGPVLIRGGRVDGAGGVGFNLNGDGPPLRELQLPPASAQMTINHDRGYREWPSYTRVRTSGCYAYQVDGAAFSYVIVFRAARYH
jgi:hypothetical protein